MAAGVVAGKRMLERPSGRSVTVGRWALAEVPPRKFHQPRRNRADAVFVMMLAVPVGMLRIVEVRFVVTVAVR